MDKLEFKESEYWQRLKDITNEKKINLKTCCEELGYVYQSILNRHQRGVYPTVEQLMSIAKFYNTSVEYLVLGTQDNIQRLAELEEQLKKISNIAASS